MLTVQGDYLYLADNSGGVKIMTLKKAKRPKIVAEVPTGEKTWLRSGILKFLNN